jgi:hypothetical protein
MDDASLFDPITGRGLDLRIKPTFLISLFDRGKQNDERSSWSDDKGIVASLPPVS